MTPPCDAECERANGCGGASECPQCGRAFCPEHRGVWLNDRCFCSGQCAKDYEDNLSKTIFNQRSTNNESI